MGERLLYRPYPFIMLCLVIVDRESALFFFLHCDFFLQVSTFFSPSCFCISAALYWTAWNRVSNYCCSIDFPGSFGTLKVYNTTEAFGIVHLCIFKTFCTLAKIVSCQFVPQKHSVSSHFSNRTILSSGSACNGIHWTRFWVVRLFFCISSRCSFSTLHL